MARRPVPVLIDLYAQRLGLDPRAVKAVAMGEGGLDWGAEGDGGYAHGPFQMNAAGGVLTHRWRTQGREAAINFANSEAGVLDAMTAMAQHARGLKGEDAIRQIITKYERPANIPLSIENAIKRLGKVGSPGGKGTANVSFGAVRTNPASSDARSSILDYLMQSTDAFVRGEESPNILSFLGSATPPTESQAAPALIGGSAGGSMPAPSQYKGAGGAKGVIDTIKRAQSMGLRVSENPYVNKVDPVHVENSDHYQTYPGTNVGRAIDVSGDANKLAAFFRWVEGNRGRLGLDDAFYTPMGYSYDEGNKTSYLQPKHDTHGHFSFR